MSEPQLENLKKARKEHNDCLCCVIKDTAIDGVLELFAAQQVLIKQLVDACKTALDFEEDEYSSPKNQEIFTKLLAVLAVAKGL